MQYVNTQAYIAGMGTCPNSEYSVSERDLITETISEAIDDSEVELSNVDGLYMPEPRSWTSQGFFSSYLTHYLGLDLTEAIEVATGGTSGAHAFQSAVKDIWSGKIDTALVCAVERDSQIDTTKEYFDYVLKLFNQEFQAPIGGTIPGLYAQSMQRYMHEYDVSRKELAKIVVKNRRNGVQNPNSLFNEEVNTEEVLSSRPVADPLKLYDCPAPCDGAAAILLTSKPIDSNVCVTGIGSHHDPSHLINSRNSSIIEMPAIKKAAQQASDQAEVPISDIDLFEPYAPFPHIEAITVEELGLADRGNGCLACVEELITSDGKPLISPSGGVIGRGHPPMVTPLINYISAIEQIQDSATVNIPNTSNVMTTAEHGHVNGVTATVISEVAQ